MADNVKAIISNKHDPQRLNYNSGVVAMKCEINNRCPLLAKFLVDNYIALNHETIKAFSDMDLKYFSAVKDLPGIFLKESYKYKSCFLYVLGEEVPPPKEAQESTEYKPWQSFNAVPSVFDNTYNLPVSDVQESRNPQRNHKQALWGYVRHNQSTDSNSSGGASSNLNEADDSNVLYIGQKASSVPGADDLPGIHWKVDKVINLYKGQDFFITFKQNTVSTDIVNKTKKESDESKMSNARKFFKGDDNPYYYLDVTHDSDTKPPANQGVVAYNRKEDSYEKVEDSAKFFYLANQPYYIIELGPNEDGDIIFIIICSKAPPTCVLKKIHTQTVQPDNDKDEPFTEEYPVTYHLSSYGENNGDFYIQQKEFTITVRNHLGNLVVYFNGDTNNPWIISPPSSRAENKDTQSSQDLKKTNLLIVPESRLSIWGGNISSSFCFSPLTYYSSDDGVSVSLPPEPKTEASKKFSIKGGEKEEKPSYEIPYTRSETGEKAIDFAGVFLSNEENDYVSKRNPEETTFYLDSHIINEFEFILPEDPEEIKNNSKNKKSFILYKTIEDMVPHFLSTGEFLKTTYLRSLIEVKEELEGEKVEKISITPTDIRLGQGDNEGDEDIILFNLLLNLKAGHHLFNSFIDIADPSPTLSALSSDSTASGLVPSFERQEWVLYNCKTPILPGFRIIAVPSKDAIAWSGGSTIIDVSDLILNYSESYTSSDFHTMDHTGTIKFLLNASAIGASGQISSWNNKINSMYNNASRAFYVDVQVGYRKVDSEMCNYSKLDESFQLFTGICYGGVIDEKAGETIMNCKIFDYTKILEDSYIFNAPFQDGMRDFNAIHEFSQMVGFRESEEKDPSYLLKQQANSENDNVVLATLDGRGSWAKAYALPNSYARLKNPFFKVQDGTAYWEAMKDIAVRGGKVLFFDTYGVLHYENLPYDRYLYSNGEVNDDDVLWHFTTSPAGEGQLVFDTLSIEKAVSDCFNIIHLVTSTPDREIGIVDKVNWPSLYNASSPGFLGYRKLFLQQDGIFGSVSSLEKLANHYSKFFVAPTIVKFQTYGLPMRSFDLCVLRKSQGQGTYGIITNINTEIDPSQNRWWSQVEAEWYGPNSFN